jgi:hypothetical protein
MKAGATQRGWVEVKLREIGEIVTTQLFEFVKQRRRRPASVRPVAAEPIRTA